MLLVRAANRWLVLCAVALAACSSGPTSPTPKSTSTSTPTPTPVATPTSVPVTTCTAGAPQPMTSFAADPATITDGDTVTLSWAAPCGFVSLAQKGKGPFQTLLPSTGTYVLRPGLDGYPTATGNTVYEARNADTATPRETTVTMNPRSTPTPTPTPAVCQNGRMWSGHCYEISTTSLGWTAGHTWCQSMGMDYAAINSAAEEDFVVAYRDAVASGSYLWLGLNDIAVAGKFVWSNGDPVTYLNWASGEPNGSGSCGCLYGGGNVWYENTCTNNYRAVCESR